MNNPTDDFTKIEPPGYEKTAAGYRIDAPVRKYVALTEPDDWTLPGSTKLQFPVNAWEYKGGSEIKKDSGMISTGYLISAATLVCLMMLK